MTDWDRVERLLGQDIMSILAQKTVGVAGVGSGGGYVALALAMTGVCNFVLLDDDTLSAANIVRHVADQRYVGQPKVDAVADLILQRNTTAQVERIYGRVEEHLDVLDRIDVLAVGVDGEGSKFAINEACLAHHRIAVYAGVYERGEGGDVVTIRPYDGPCYACWADALREGHIMPAPDGSDEEMDYGQVRPDGTIAAEPGLWLDVVRVANTQATMVLNVLLEDTAAKRDFPANTVLIANQAIELLEGQITPPASAEWVNIPRNPTCLICGDHYQSQSADDSLSLDMLLNVELSQEDRKTEEK